MTHSRSLSTSHLSLFFYFSYPQFLSFFIAPNRSSRPINFFYSFIYFVYTTNRAFWSKNLKNVETERERERSELRLVTAELCQILSHVSSLFCPQTLLPRPTSWHYFGYAPIRAPPTRIDDLGSVQPPFSRFSGKKNAKEYSN